MTAALEGGEWSAARPGHILPLGKTWLLILQEDGWAPEPVWTGRKSCPHWDSIPDRFLYRSIIIKLQFISCDQPGKETFRVLAA